MVGTRHSEYPHLSQIPAGLAQQLIAVCKDPSLLVNESNFVRTYADWERMLKADIPRQVQRNLR